MTQDTALILAKVKGQGSQKKGGAEARGRGGQRLALWSPPPPPQVEEQPGGKETRSSEKALLFILPILWLLGSSTVMTDKNPCPPGVYILLTRQ